MEILLFALTVVAILLSVVAITNLKKVRRDLLDEIERPFPFSHEMVAKGVIVGDMTLCGPGCAKPVRGGGDIWCRNHKDCTARKGCGCHLFSRHKNAPPYDPDSWKHEAEPEKKVKENENRRYHSFCVK